jgi:hypothetical protein
MGFYTDLQEELKAGDWSYVPNQNGGFMGFYWGSKQENQYEKYLQLEERKLCFKIDTEEKKEERGKIRNECHKKYLESTPSNSFPFERPKRFGNGRYMTVFIYKEDGIEDYRVSDNNGFIDMKKTLERIKLAEKVFGI